MVKMNYSEFLQMKKPKSITQGIDTAPPGYLFDFQKTILRRALNAGRYAIFADCGLGKTPMQIAWANEIHQHTRRNVLIVAPLAVAEQTVREGGKFGVSIHYQRTPKKTHTITITNYEMLEHFDPAQFAGIVLDESSILKNFSGSTRRTITDFAKRIQYRLACTATPAPNDLIEIINHAEFLGVAEGKEIIANYFIVDGNTTHAWRLRNYAVNDFWQWVATWATACRKPSDVGGDDALYELPKLLIRQHQVEGWQPDGYLFPMAALDLQEQRKAKRETLGARVETASLLAKTDAPCVIWCHLNDESAALKKSIPDAVEVSGADSLDEKVQRLTAFSTGAARVLITKPSIAGFGMNWQHCNHMVFVGVDHSFEKFYQAVRRCWRFGQERDVIVDVIWNENESSIMDNIRRKQSQADDMMSQIIKQMGADVLRKERLHIGSRQIKTPSWMATERQDECINQ